MSLPRFRRYCSPTSARATSLRSRRRLAVLLRAIPPTPVVGCVGLVPDVRRIPSRWRRGDTVALLRGEGAELVRFVWQHAHRFSLAHDTGSGGLEQTLEEAAAWSRLPLSQATK